jgi:CRISPR-associated protein Csb2
MSRFQAWARRHPDRAGHFRRAGRADDFASPVLSGKGPDGSMRRDHRHAYYLPAADGDDPRRITHVCVWAADGLGMGGAGDRAGAGDGADSGEVAALAGLRRLRVSADLELRVRLVGLGRPADFTARLFRPARVWQSATPFVGPAHVGRRGRDRDLRKAVRRDLRRLVAAGRLASEPTAVEVLPASAGPVPPLSFRRHRSKPTDTAARPAAFVRLTFAEPVSGPLAIGYASHFGLGLFVPAD